MTQPTRIVVLPSGTVIVLVETEYAAEQWRIALFATPPSDDSKKSLVIIAEGSDVVVTDLRR